MLQNKFYRSLQFVSRNWKYHTGGRERLFLYQKKEAVISYPHYPVKQNLAWKQKKTAQSSQTSSE